MDRIAERETTVQAAYPVFDGAEAAELERAQSRKGGVTEKLVNWFCFIRPSMSLRGENEAGAFGE